MRANLLAKDLSRAKLHIMLNQTDLAEHDLQSLKARVINTFDRVDLAQEKRKLIIIIDDIHNSIS